MNHPECKLQLAFLQLHGRTLFLMPRIYTDQHWFWGCRTGVFVHIGQFSSFARKSSARAKSRIWNPCKSVL